jgi:hypothetical protein
MEKFYAAIKNGNSLPISSPVLGMKFFLVPKLPFGNAVKTFHFVMLLWKWNFRSEFPNRIWELEEVLK